MAKGSVNKVILIGHLGADPEVKYTANNLAVANISVATNSATKDKQTGEWTTITEWHRVVFFDRLAEIVKEYLRKGSQVYIEGRLSTEKWTDKNGVDRWTTKIIANDMQMLGGKGENASSSYSQSAPGYNQTHSSAASERSIPPPSSDIDDDVPF